MTVTGPEGGEADRAARERLAREARETASALLDWVGTRVETAGPARGPDGSGRPRQSPGPCTWCPVCALVAALRGEQPELTATLAEQASGLLVMLRLVLQTHATGAHGPAAAAQAGPEHPTRPGSDPFAAQTPGADPTAQDPGMEAGFTAAAAEGSAARGPAQETAGAEVPWDVAPHALFDPDPGPAPAAGDTEQAVSRAAAERPAGKRGPRPSPRRTSPGELDGPAAAPRAFPQPDPEPPVASSGPGAPPIPTPVGPADAPSYAPPPTDGTGVQRIPIRRRTRPC